MRHAPPADGARRRPSGVAHARRPARPSPASVDVIINQAADEAMTALLGKLHTFEGRSRFTHLGVQVRHPPGRHRRSAPAVAAPEVELRDLDLPDRPPPHDSPEHHAEGTDLAGAVAVAMRTVLTPYQRRIAIALLVDGVPIDVLAQRLGTSRGALYKTVHDARARLRGELTAKGYLPSHRDPPLRRPHGPAPRQAPHEHHTTVHVRAWARAAVDALLLDTTPWLSCDDCFARMDTYVEALLSDPHHRDAAMDKHLRGCAACDEEARSLACPAHSTTPAERSPATTNLVGHCGIPRGSSALGIRSAGAYPSLHVGGSGPDAAAQPGTGRSRERLAAGGGRGGHGCAGRRPGRRGGLLPHRRRVRAGFGPPLPLPPRQGGGWRRQRGRDGRRPVR